MERARALGARMPCQHPQRTPPGSCPDRLPGTPSVQAQTVFLVPPLGGTREEVWGCGGNADCLPGTPATATVLFNRVIDQYI